MVTRSISNRVLISNTPTYQTTTREIVIDHCERQIAEEQFKCDFRRDLKEHLL